MMGTSEEQRLNVFVFACAGVFGIRISNSLSLYARHLQLTRAAEERNSVRVLLIRRYPNGWSIRTHSPLRGAPHLSQTVTPH